MPPTRCLVRLVSLLSLAVAIVAPASSADAGKEQKPAKGGVGVATGAIPGGAIVSARYAAVLPIAGGDVVCVPLAADGTFKLEGLTPGRYRLALTSQPVTKQTQGATFGEKVNAGLHAAGSALAQGARDLNSGMPNRISMNVTMPKQTLRVEVDGSAVEIEVNNDRSLQGRATVAPATTDAPPAASN